LHDILVLNANCAIENWVNVPTNSILTIHGQTVMVHPIQDRYYDRNPHHKRSAAYVQTKGLAANEKNSAAKGGAPSTPAAGMDQEILKRVHGPTIPFGTNARPREIEASSSTSHIPRTRTPLSQSETQTQTAQSDIRTVTAPPPVARTNSGQQTPAQGNIKKKRASLSAVDANNHGPINPSAFVDMEQSSSPLQSPDPPDTGYGNPNKIAQFFPELNLA
jgi:glutamine amidotransferase